MLALVLSYSILRGASSMDYQWQWYRVPTFFIRTVDGTSINGPLLRGIQVTGQIVAYAAGLTLLVGLLTAVLRMSSSWAARALTTVYIELIRNTPLLVQIYVFYFVLGPILGIGRFWVGVLGLTFFEATFAAEVIRGALLAVSRGQREAAQVLGLTSLQIFRLVIFPQAVPLMIPPLTGVLVNVVKNSAVVSVIAVADLSTEGRNLVSDTLMSFEVWLTVGAMYLSITLPLSAFAQWLEGRVRISG
jgi:polar amino acid transport system permease protein